MRIASRITTSAPVLGRRAYRKLQTQIRQWNFARPGEPNRLARVLDEQAMRRTMQAFIRHTNDAATVEWLGHQVWQYPMDAWLIQEVISRVRPALVVETGTYRGGSAFFFASIFDLLGEGEVITIDVKPTGTVPHPRVTYITGSSVDPNVVDQVRERMNSLNGPIIVILDSDHSKEHVRAELETYAPVIPVGSYIHVQDGCIDELPVFGKFPGPRAAAIEFLRAHPEFTRDQELERRFLMTGHPYGWLRRVRSD
jgi:cephalosporin hydroxylase